MTMYLRTSLIMLVGLMSMVSMNQSWTTGSSLVTVTRGAGGPGRRYSLTEMKVRMMGIKKLIR